jgi:lipoprotein-anchoring transpeptidase ErfK/SrfK
MLRIILLVAVFLGLTSSAYAAQPSLFGDFFGKSSIGKSSITKASLTVAPARAISATGPIAITIDITTQEMTVSSVDGRTIYSFDVSTGRKGYSTPTGSFKPIRMHKMWYSAKYENAPMPYSIFFHGGYAIHGTTDIANLGTVASHGCVRLHPDNAELLYNLVNKVGMKNTKISLIRS